MILASPCLPVATLAALLIAQSLPADAAPLRIHLISGCKEYDSAASLKGYRAHLEQELGARVTASWVSDGARSLPAMEQLSEADLLIVYARRLDLPEATMAQIRQHWQAGKPVIGIRTASHAFTRPENEVFDRQVLGGNYQGHFGDGRVEVANVPDQADHPLLEGVNAFRSRKLYKAGELAAGTVVLQTGRLDDGTRFPVSWVHEYRGGRIFYTSLGVQEDFREPSFIRLLDNAVRWTTQPLAATASPGFAFQHHYLARELPPGARLTGSCALTALVDLDRDGDLDFVVGGRTPEGPRLYWFEFQSADQWQQHLVGKDYASDVGLAALDVDRDGWIDLVCSGVWYRNPGKPRTQPFQRLVFDPNAAGAHDVLAADIDGDGNPDVVMMGDDRTQLKSLRWYSIPADPTQPWPFQLIGPPVHGAIIPSGAGDLDGDGDTDVVRADTWFENRDGKGREWIAHPNLPMGRKGPYGVCVRTALVDLDGDGSMEIVMNDADIVESKMAVLKNADGKGGQWTRIDLPQSFPYGSLHSLAVADFNGDGRPDIVSNEQEELLPAGRQNPRWVVWENTGNLQFREHIVLDTKLGGHELVVGDVDGDGDVDICSKPWGVRAWNGNGGGMHLDFLENRRLSAAAAVRNADYWVYFGTYTGKKSRGIYVSRMNGQTGRLTEPVLAAEATNPSFLALHPNRRFLYAVGEVWDGPNKGGATAFAIDPQTGLLRRLNEQSSGGTGPCHLAVDPSGRSLLVANYGGGSIAALPIGSDGQLAPATAFLQHHGSSTNPQRQKEPHAHGIYTDPANRFVFVPDLGIDKIMIYRFDPANGTLVPNEPPFAQVEPGAGPRHFTFHPTARFAYVINELASTITAFHYDPNRGALSPRQTVSTLPDSFAGRSTTAEIEVHPSGRFLYGSNRGHDTLAVFEIDADTGRLTLIEHVSTQGKTPRNFAADPTGRWLLAANQGTDNVVVYQIDASTGKLTPTGQTLSIGAPVCVLFVPNPAR